MMPPTCSPSLPCDLDRHLPQTCRSKGTLPRGWWQKDQVPGAAVVADTAVLVAASCPGLGGSEASLVQAALAIAQISDGHLNKLGQR